MKQMLSVEQSAELIRKGVPEYKASETAPINDGEPIFTLADICSLFPKEIEIDAHRCGLNMWYHNAHYWMVSYVQFDGAEIAYQSTVVSRDTLIDALYEFLCLCIRNGHIDLTK